MAAKDHNDIDEIELDSDTVKEACEQFFYDLRKIVDANKADDKELGKILKILTSAYNTLDRMRTGLHSTIGGLESLYKSFNAIAENFPKQSKENQTK